MTMNKNQYVDSVMRALGNSSIELTLDELKFFSDLESVSRSYLTNKLERLYKILGKNKPSI